MSFVHLHTHSYYSLLDGTADLDALLFEARRQGFKSLALTDHNGLYGAISFYRKAREMGIHPIIGAEITLTDNSNLILLVKNDIGYRNLCKIITQARLDGGHLGFKIAARDLVAFKSGLFILSGGQKGFLWQSAKARNIDDCEQYCRQMKRMFGNSFFIELQHFHHNDVIVNMRLRDLGHQHRIPIVGTNDVHLLTPKDKSNRLSAVSETFAWRVI